MKKLQIAVLGMLLALGLTNDANAAFNSEPATYLVIAETMVNGIPVAIPVRVHEWDGGSFLNQSVALFNFALRYSAWQFHASRDFATYLGIYKV